MNYDFHRNANVVIDSHKDAKNRVVANMTVDGEYQHRFAHNSRITKALELMTPADLSERMSGGQYFFVEGILYDFRDGLYNGYVHDDDTISHLNELLGITGHNSRSDLRVHENVTAGNVTLGRQWSKNNIKINAFREGGEFESELHYGWSPFMKTINSAFKLNRLICENGMRGLRNFMNTKIPLVNRWEEHLDIANIQIQNKVDSIVQRRLVQMSTERASVKELLVLAGHATNRLRDDEGFSETNTKLRNIRNIVDPKNFLNGIYQSHVFTKSAVSAQYPGHLTTLDAYNIATEIRSHSNETQNSTTHALDIIANDFVFDHDNIILPSSGTVGRKTCAFSDPDAAYFGNMH